MTHKIKELDESMTYGRRSINRFVAAPRYLWSCRISWIQRLACALRFS